MKLQRKITFSSGHRYWFDHLSEQENRALFGEWASPFNHGHNYVLFVTAEGSVDPVNVMVVNIKWIDDLLKDQVIRVLNQKSINDEVPHFKKAAPCLENLLLWLSQELQELPGNAVLTHLKLEEHPQLYGEYDVKSSRLSLTRIYEFAASHRLYSPVLSPEENWRLYNKCSHPHGHGHNYVLEVTVSGKPDARTGMIVDIVELDRIVDENILQRYDHRNLDLDIPELQGKVSTSEVVAQTIFDTLVERMPSQLERVRLHETARNIFEVTR